MVEMMQAPRTTVKCPVCNSAENAVAEQAPPFTIRQCAQCGLQFADPLGYATEFYDAAYGTPAAAAAHEQQSAYGDRMVKAQEDGLADPLPLLTAAQRRALRWLRGHVAKGEPVLDVGCGVGYFLSAVRRQGHQPYGIDVAESPIQFLRGQGISAAVGTVAEVPREWPVPAVVTAFEVMEHLPNPVDFLRQIRERFPQSRLLLTVPSPRRWTLAIGPREGWDYPPHHLTRWNQQALSAAFSAAGYGRITILSPLMSPYEITGTGLGVRLRAFSRKLRSPRVVPGPSPEQSLREASGEPAGQPGSEPTLTEARLQRTKALFYWPLAVFMTLAGRRSVNILVIAEAAADQAKGGAHRAT